LPNRFPTQSLLPLQLLLLRLAPQRFLSNALLTQRLLP